MRLIIIYKLICLITNKSYIGQTKNGVIKRISNHITADSFIGSAIRKHELRNFKLEFIWEAINKKEANIVEQAAIFTHNTKVPNGYNLTDGGEGLINPSKETKEKMSKSHQGIKNSKHSKKMQGNQYAKGKHWKLSEKFCENNSKRMRGNKLMQGKKNPNAHSIQSEIKRLRTRIANYLSK